MSLVCCFCQPWRYPHTIPRKAVSTNATAFEAKTSAEVAIRNYSNRSTADGIFFLTHMDNVAHISVQTDRQTGRQAGRQADKERQTDRDRQRDRGRQ